ncbi:MAG: sigma-70 family RNA polymerase sigma factor [Candidatus Competibacteraceae bacterium]|nr:sigma-70 family RNA polymerase sigma factor [Candidatus Competibacteraceae bacterium]MBK8899015.1 sigma-70 family RNA polymerase sigma factor [Candidatus Competibacteraceae bacterium]MBK8963057.1 sigma-70 family RNA polymerase sigma factor [Candidatus Competibacteraceae bacterium]MBK9952020.1 sigma-70 family RNA polymerase sigma factor [Candidatus Competibacteraceae bacterium]
MSQHPAPSRFSAGTAAETTDLELIRAVAGKDRHALKQLYERYAPRIGRYLLKLLKQPELVDEAVNDTMLALWQSADRFDPAAGQLLTWLFGIAHNKGLKTLRRTGRFRADQSIDTLAPDVLDEAEDREPSLRAAPHGPEQTVLGWELGGILQWALEQLSTEHRSVIELAFGEELAYPQIAEIVGCPLNTVKTRMFHARKRLAQLLARRGYRDVATAQEE